MNCAYTHRVCAEAIINFMDNENFDKRNDRFGEIDDNDFGKVRNGIKNLFDLTNIHPALRRESMGKSQK